MMIDLLDRQQSLTINQWKIFAAVILTIEELDATLARPKRVAARPG